MDFWSVLIIDFAYPFRDNNFFQSFFHSIVVQLIASNPTARHAANIGPRSHMEHFTLIYQYLGKNATNAEFIIIDFVSVLAPCHQFFIKTLWYERKLTLAAMLLLLNILDFF